MTKLFQQVVGKVSQLPEEEQDAIARIVLDEMDSDKRWSDLFGRSPKTLSKLADEAWAEHERGESKALDPDKL